MVVNTDNFPRLIFEFDNEDYVKITRIPFDRKEYLFLVYSVKVLLKKMLHHNLIHFSELKKLEEPGK